MKKITIAVKQVVNEYWSAEANIPDNLTTEDAVREYLEKNFYNSVEFTDLRCKDLSDANGDEIYEINV
jgi:hypothetical protein